MPDEPSKSEGKGLPEPAAPLENPNLDTDPDDPLVEPHPDEPGIDPNLDVPRGGGSAGEEDPA